MTEQLANVALAVQAASDAATATTDGLAQSCGKLLGDAWSALERLLSGDVQGASAAVGPSLTSCYNAVLESVGTLQKALGLG